MAHCDATKVAWDNPRLHCAITWHYDSTGLLWSHNAPWTLERPLWQHRAPQCTSVHGHKHCALIIPYCSIVSLQYPTAPSPCDYGTTMRSYAITILNCDITVHHYITKLTWDIKHHYSSIAHLLMMSQYSNTTSQCFTVILWREFWFFSVGCGAVLLQSSGSWAGRMRSFWGQFVFYRIPFKAKRENEREMILEMCLSGTLEFLGFIPSTAKLVMMVHNGGRRIWSSRASLAI